MDDRPLSIDNLVRGFQSSSDIHVLFTAANGIDMQELLLEHGPPHVVVLDVEMPRMNGYQTARWLRLHHPQVRILAISALPVPGVVYGMLRSGAHGLLPKGLASRTACEAVLEVVREGVLLNEHVTNEMLEAVALADAAPGLESLSPRQLELLRLSNSDDTYELIADKMCLSVHTVKRYASELNQLFGVHSRSALLLEARKIGLLPLDD